MVNIGGTWNPPPIQETLNQDWDSTEFQNKSAITNTNRVIHKGALAYYYGFVSTTTHCLQNDNLIFLCLYIFNLNMVYWT